MITLRVLIIAPSHEGQSTPGQEANGDDKVMSFQSSSK